MLRVFQISVLIVFSILFMNGCIPNQHYEPVQKQRDPGLYGSKGWSYAPCYFPGSGPANCNSKDIDGKVGYSVYVAGPRSTCVPDGNWTQTTPVIVSGQLPPGLSFGKWYDIEGIPQKRGHWIVKIEIKNRYCSGIKYHGIKQELRFHITGSGKVNY